MDTALTERNRRKGSNCQPNKPRKILLYFVSSLSFLSSNKERKYSFSNCTLLVSISTAVGVHYHVPKSILESCCTFLSIFHLSLVAMCQTKMVLHEKTTKCLRPGDLQWGDAVTQDQRPTSSSCCY